MEQISIPFDEKEYIAALLFAPASPPRGVMAICHGLRGGKENSGHIYGFAQKLVSRGFVVVAFDFRGSGDSSGEFSQMTLSRQAADLQKVCAYLNDRYQLPPLILGRSFGGTTVIASAPHIKTASGYILWSAPFDLPSSFSYLLGDDYQCLLSGHSVTRSDSRGRFIINPSLIQDLLIHDMKQNLQAMQGKPVLIVHGKEDESVAFTNAQQIAACLPAATLYLVPEADHRFTGMVEHRETITLEWLDASFESRVNTLR